MTLQILTFLIVAISAFLALQQIRRTQEWNRRKASQDLLFQVVIGDVNELRKHLETVFGVDILRLDKPYGSVVSALPGNELEKFKYEARTMFNYLETVAIGIKNHVFDEEICYEHLSLVATRYWAWGKPLIQEMRGIEPTVWIEQEHFNTKWRQRLDTELSALRTKGKPAT